MHELYSIVSTVKVTIRVHQQIVQMLAILNLAYMNLITFQLIFDLRYFLPSRSSWTQVMCK